MSSSLPPSSSSGSSALMSSSGPLHNSGDCVVDGSVASLSAKKSSEIYEPCPPQYAFKSPVNASAETIQLMLHNNQSLQLRAASPPILSHLSPVIKNYCINPQRTMNSPIASIFQSSPKSPKKSPKTTDNSRFSQSLSKLSLSCILLSDH